MTDLAIRDLVIEYSSGGYPVRPIDGLSLDVGLRAAKAGDDQIHEVRLGLTWAFSYKKEP